MWLVKNTLGKATLSFRGLDVSIAPGEQFDLDVLGRDTAESSNQVLVAFEEGYLESVYKASAQDQARDAGDAPTQPPSMGPGMSVDEFDERMGEFRKQFIDELRQQLSVVPVGKSDDKALDAMREVLSQDVKSLVGEMKLLRDRFDSVRGQVQQDPTLSDTEIKARLAFLAEQEQSLLRNFETVGRRSEIDDGDVMDKADLLAGL